MYKRQSLSTWTSSTQVWKHTLSDKYSKRGALLSSAPLFCALPWKYSSGGILASAAAKCLPQNTQNSQNRLLGMVSHRFHRFTQKLGCLQGGALVSSAPTKQEVHQPSNIDIPLVTLVHLRQVHPLKLAGSVNSACSVGGILLRRRPETSATIFAP